MSRTVQVVARVPEALVEALEAHRLYRGLRTRTDALVEVLHEGLRAVAPDPDALVEMQRSAVLASLDDDATTRAEFERADAAMVRGAFLVLVGRAAREDVAHPLHHPIVGHA